MFKSFTLTSSRFKPIAALFLLYSLSSHVHVRADNASEATPNVPIREEGNLYWDVVANAYILPGDNSPGTVYKVTTDQYELPSTGPDSIVESGVKDYETVDIEVRTETVPEGEQMPAQNDTASQPAPASSERNASDLQTETSEHTAETTGVNQPIPDHDPAVLNTDKSDLKSQDTNGPIPDTEVPDLNNDLEADKQSPEDNDSATEVDKDDQMSSPDQNSSKNEASSEASVASSSSDNHDASEKPEEPSKQQQRYESSDESNHYSASRSPVSSEAASTAASSPSNDVPRVSNFKNQTNYQTDTISSSEGEQEPEHRTSRWDNVRRKGNSQESENQFESEDPCAKKRCLGNIIKGFFGTRQRRLQAKRPIHILAELIEKQKQRQC